MDDIDLAQRNDEIFRRQSLERHFRRAGREEVENDAIPGICLDCENPIEKERLRVMPDAVRCVDCQRKKERKA